MRSAILWFVAIGFASTASAEPVPQVATRQLMRKIARGTIAPANLVDPATGVLVIEYTSGEREPPITKTARRLCGDAARREIVRHREHLARSIAQDEIFACRNRPSPPFCDAGIGGEGDVKTRYVFRPTAGGALVLDTLITTNSVYNPDDEKRVVAQLQRRHAGGTCPP